MDLKFLLLTIGFILLTLFLFGCIGPRSLRKRMRALIAWQWHGGTHPFESWPPVSKYDDENQIQKEFRISWQFVILYIILAILFFTLTKNFMNSNDAKQVSRANSQEALGYQRLVETVTSYPKGQYQEAFQAIIAELQNRNEDPKEFYIKQQPLPESGQTGSFIFLLMHEDSFKQENFRGNPTGKDREVIYDLASKKVEFLLWQ